MACRSCTSSRLLEVLDLGLIHISAFLAPSEPDTPKTPVVLVLCESCSLLQLKHYIEPDIHFTNFRYRSGLTATMRNALLDVVEGVSKRIDIRRGDTVVDIGSNDSTLLRYWSPNFERIGFEPAENHMAEARETGLTIVNDYFSHTGLREVTGKKAKVITAIACMYDVNNLNQFCVDIKQSLAADGVFCVQLMSLRQMLANNDIGNLTQEHVTHFSLTSLESLLERHGLYVFDAEENDVNGGSLRVYSSPTLRSPSAALVMLRHDESKAGYSGAEVYRAFARRVEQDKTALKYLVDYHYSATPDEPLYAYGASTKGNLMLDYWGLTREDIPFAVERDPRKVGLEMVASRIPIISEFEGRERSHRFLVLPYAFREEMIKRECGWLKQGGQLIFPLPKLEIVTTCANSMS